MENFQNLLQSVEITWFQIALAFLILIVTYFLNQIMLKFSLYLYQQQVFVIRKLRFWIPLVRIILWGGGIFFSIKVLHPPAELIFALVTSAGVAIGLAAQELVKYIFGAIIIWSDKIYQEGDRITIGEVEGIVQSIGLRSTKVWAYDDTIIVVPNSQLLNTIVYNSNSGDSAEQILVDLYLSLDVDSDKAAQLAKLAAISSDLVEPNKPVSVLVSDYLDGRTAMTRIRLKVYVRNVLYEKRLASEVSTRAKRLFRQNNLYQTSTTNNKADSENSNAISNASDSNNVSG